MGDEALVATKKEAGKAFGEAGRHATELDDYRELDLGDKAVVKSRLGSGLAVKYFVARGRPPASSELHGGALDLSSVLALQEVWLRVPSNYGRVWTTS